MDKIISTGAFAGATLALSFAVFDKPYWIIQIAFAIGGGIVGFILAVVLNKVFKKRNK